MALKPLSSAGKNASQTTRVKKWRKSNRPGGVTNWIRRENVLVGVQSVVLFFSRIRFFFSGAK
jgi:hypothetical protein